MRRRCYGIIDASGILHDAGRDSAAYEPGIHTHTHTHIYIPTHTHTNVDACLHIHIHTFTHTCRHTYIKIHTHARTHAANVLLIYQSNILFNTIIGADPGSINVHRL